MNTDIQEFIFPDKTPFHMEEAWESRLENKNRSCTHFEIDSLILKNIIGPADLMIMRALATYKFLNSYNLDFFINRLSPLHEYYKKETFSANLKKLVKAGILARYHFIRYDEGGSISASPLRFYDLIPGAYSYIAPVTAGACPLQAAMDDTRKLELLALNQFLMRMRFNYPSVRTIHYLTWKKAGTKAFCIDAAIRCPAPAALFGEQEKISIFPIPVRFGPGWKSNAATRYQSLRNWLGKNQERHPFPFPIFLCESLEMGELLFHSFRTMDELRYLPFYFVTDGAVLSCPLWDCLFSSRISEETGETVTIRHHLDRQRQSL